MSKTSLNNLNEYLFEALDRVTNDDLNGEELQEELQRADSITQIARAIIDNGNLTLKVMEHLEEYGKADKIVCNLLEEK